MEMMMRQLSEGKDWEYIIPEDKGTTINLKLTSGDYINTIYQYGKVKVEEASDGAMYLKFVYNIVETPYNKEELEKSEDFKNYIGDVLVNIMSQNLEEGIIDEAGTSYSEESDNE
jgi:hypothetical protein